MKKNSTATNRPTVRPRAALITNHGYAGPDLPIGGAPDTGGQNLYVHNLAKALDTIGYNVTIFARGGFPFFDSKKMRTGIQPFMGNIRYVFIPGGGNQFIRKEDIAIAIDEELDWLEAFIAEEAQALSMESWAVYEFINTHYWDAAVLGVGLVRRWQDTVVARAVVKLLEEVVDQEILEAFLANAHVKAVGLAPAYHLGRLLLESQGNTGGPFLKSGIKEATRRWANHHRKDASLISSSVERTLASFRRTVQTIRPMLAAEALGDAMFQAKPKTAAQLRTLLAVTDRHVWTPHSLGVLKEERFKGHPDEERRSLKFCERRNHEFTVSRQTKAFAATSTELAERMISRLDVRPESLFYFPPCIDHDRFRTHDDEETAGTYRYLSKETGIKAKTLREGRVLFETSRMDNSKRKDVLLKAFARIAKDLPDTYLVIGGGPDNDVFKNLGTIIAESPELKGRAFLLGYIPDKYLGPLFALATAYVSPSDMEGFGMSVAQAAASATPIVCTDTLPFAVQYAPKEARLVPPGDVEAFAAAIKGLLSDPESAETLGYRLAGRVEQLNWHTQTEQFLRYLRRQGFPISISTKRRAS